VENLKAVRMTHGRAIDLGTPYVVVDEVTEEIVAAFSNYSDAVRFATQRGVLSASHQEVGDQRTTEESEHL
jgi:ABC-type proline/glycine betaine transport system ATPase subunit